MLGKQKKQKKRSTVNGSTGASCLDGWVSTALTVDRMGSPLCSSVWAVPRRPPSHCDTVIFCHRVFFLWRLSACQLTSLMESSLLNQSLHTEHTPTQSLGLQRNRTKLCFWSPKMCVVCVFPISDCWSVPEGFRQCLKKCGSEPKMKIVGTDLLWPVKIS